VCLVFVAWRAHPRYRLVVAANRDEFHGRPTAPAAPWEDIAGPPNGEPAAARPILAGRDLQAGGTWLGVTPEGRFAALTNYRGAVPPAVDAPSRGRLVVDFLRSGAGARDLAREVAREAGRYSGFNLLLADRDDLLCVTNRGKERAMEISPGCHGLGNDRLNAPEEKVTGGLAEFRQILRSGFNVEDLFALLADDEPAGEAEPGESELARSRSARFIRAEVYGTRSSTVLLVERDGAIAFEERSFDPRALETGRVAFTRPVDGETGFREVGAPLLGLPERATLADRGTRVSAGSGAGRGSVPRADSVASTASKRQET